MIQRIQTVYYLLAAGLSLGVPTLGFYFNYAGEELSIKTSQTLFIANVISAVLCIFAIVLFRNRKVQIALGRAALLLNIGVIAYLIYYLVNLPGALENAEKGIALITPFVCIVALYFANKAVIKDEKLVKSVDRIR